MISEAELEELLSRPLAADVAAMAALPGDLVILGVAGKMGPSLARLARRASDQAGVPRRVVGVARFSVPGAREALERGGIETVQCDVLDRAALARLPDAPNVVHMVGQKFGTSSDQLRTWATNVLAASLAAERFAASRIVAFSTGNVYPLTSIAGGAPSESDPTGPVGEYAQSALGRERILEYWSRCNTTPMAILRLNYAVEPRYGVLRDLADRVALGRPIELAMGYVNVIWQRDANAIALRCFAHCATPPFVLNVTGPDHVAVRALATRIGERLGRTPVFAGAESATALLSDAARCQELFGPPSMDLEAMIGAVADWVRAGGGSLGKPTHFEEQEGRF